MLKRILTARIKAFAADTRGAVSVEFMLMMPMLFWAFMATYVFFEGYRQSSINLKAAYTISDMISRETEVIDDVYVDSMYELMQVLTRTSSPLNLRITVIRWDAGDDRYYVDWSSSRGYANNLNDANIGDIETRLPIMPDNERVILVESVNTFVPLFDIGLENQDLTNFVFIRPRFVDQVCGFTMPCAIAS